MKKDDQYTYDEYDDDYYYEDEDLEVEEYANYQEEEYDDYDNDEYEEEGFSIKSLFDRNKILTLVMVVVAFCVIIFTGTKILSNHDKKGEKEEVVVKNKELESNLTKDIDTIKEKVLTYYTEENIPKEVNDNTLHSLKELKEKKVIDKLSNKDYDLKKSYVKLTKQEDNYKLDIYLNTKKLSKSKVFEVNHYAYCINTFLCVKNDKLEDSGIMDDTNIEEGLEQEENSTSENIGEKTYVYKYVKSSNPRLSEWSLWSNYQRTDCKTSSITCGIDDIKCLKEIKLFTRKEKIGTYPKVYRTNKNTLIVNQKENKSACTNYDYVKINGNYYQIPLNSNYHGIIGISSSTKASRGNWGYQGRRTYQSPPADTINTRYILVGMDDSNCGDTCANLPNLIYDVYTFNKSMIKVGNTSSNCKGIATKQIPMYSIAPSVVSVTRNEGLYGTICYFSERARKVITSGKGDVKWSSYNNQDLLNKGYIYTGEKRED